MKQSKVTIVGSLNIDLVVETSNIPLPGETVLGERFIALPGGKGNNQAVACARLGAEVSLIGCVGDDIYGELILNNLNREKIKTNNINTLTGISTGVASITVAEGENHITVVQGANKHLTPRMIEEKEKVIKESDIILLQLEIPLETVIKTIKIAEANKVPVVLNPAPAMRLPKEILEKVKVLTPNEHEVFKIFGLDNANGIEVYSLMKSFPEKLIMTKGKEGAYYVNQKKETMHVQSHVVKAVDTTGAGDSFNAGLVVKLGQGESIQEAVKYGVAVGALSVTKFGAQAAMPTAEQVRLFLKAKNK